MHGVPGALGVTGAPGVCCVPVVPGWPGVPAAVVAAHARGVRVQDGRVVERPVSGGGAVDDGGRGRAALVVAAGEVQPVRHVAVGHVVHVERDDGHPGPMALAAHHHALVVETENN